MFPTVKISGIEFMALFETSMVLSNNDSPSEVDDKWLKDALVDFLKEQATGTAASRQHLQPQSEWD